MLTTNKDYWQYADDGGRNQGTNPKNEGQDELLSGEDIRNISVRSKLYRHSIPPGSSMKYTGRQAERYADITMRSAEQKDGELEILEEIFLSAFDIHDEACCRVWRRNDEKRSGYGNIGSVGRG